MNSGVTINRQFHVRSGHRNRKELHDGAANPPLPLGRIPRVSRLMALAIRFDKLIRDGAVADQAELARLGYVSRARMTQIMNLLNLASEIQEQILFLPRVEHGRDPVTERDLRPIVGVADWQKQRQMWAALPARTTSEKTSA